MRLLLPSLPLLGVAVAFAGCPRRDRDPPPVHVQLLAFNDFHGHLEPPPGDLGLIRTGEREPDGGLTRLPDGRIPAVPAGGATYFATHLKALEAANPHTLVVSAGDLIGGSPFLSGAYHDEPTVELMNQLGLDIAAVGNHEFDEGAVELMRMQRGGCHPTDRQGSCAHGPGSFHGAGFTYLAANVEYTDGGELFPRAVVKELDGAKIAFIGMTLEGTPILVPPAAIAGLRFKDEVETVNALIPALRAQGTEAIVVVIHQGGEQLALDQRSPQSCFALGGPIVDIAQRLDDEVDVILSGHTHQSYNCVIHGKLVTSAESYGRVITAIDLQVTRSTAGKPSVVVSKEARQELVTRDVREEAAAQALVSDYNARVAPVRDRPVGYLAGSLTTASRRTADGGFIGEHAMGDVVADAQLAATRDAGSVIAFTNPGGVRAELLTDGGPITYGQLFTVQPFQNYLITKELTGEQIHRLLEQQFSPPNDQQRILLVSSGFRYAYSRFAVAGAHVDAGSITLNGKVLDPARTYRVTTNNFLATGGDNFSVLTEGTHTIEINLYDVDALELYLRQNSDAGRPLPVPPLDRIGRLD